MQSGRFGEAIDLLNKYVAQNAQKADGYNLRGLCFEKRTQYAKAVLDFRRAHKIEPDNIEIKKNLDRTLSVWHALLRKRIEGFKREIAIDPSNPFNYLEIGKSYRWLEEWSKAEQWYDEYLKRDDDASPDEVIRYTIILVKTRHITKGEKILKKYVERYPEDWRLWSRYGYFTLWLGKYGIAKDAFTKALGFKPFFKEAQDGLDLATKKGYVTLYQPEDYEKAERERGQRQIPQEYPIDKYFRIVNKNPDDVDTRFALIDELIVADRWEEAYQQIQLIPPEYEDSDRYQLLWDKISQYRENQYMSKIEELHYNLKKNPDNPETVKELAITYSSKEDYEEAEEILTDFLNVHPDNDSLGFLYAKILSYDRKYDEAYEQAIKVVDENPGKPEYRLLAGQLGTWLDRDTDRALEDLQTYNESYLDDIYGLIALGTLSFAKEEYDAAEEYEQRAEAIDPDNSDLLQLKSMIELKRLRDDEDKKIEQLNYGRELAYNKEYEEAIPYYEEYLRETGENREIEAELADVYMGAEMYEDALGIYSSLLNDEYDVDVAKRQIPALLNVSDSLRALEELEKIVEEDPDDPEMKLYLGDLYASQGEPVKAKHIYEELQENAPESYMIEERLSWLPIPPEEQSFFQRNVSNYIFSYANLSPFGYVFNDNLDFQLLYGGIGAEVGLLKFLSAGGQWYRGYLSNATDKVHFTSLKGSLFFRLGRPTLFTISYGKVTSPGIIDQPVFETSLIYERPDTIRVALMYMKNDAAILLYSPYLLYTRLVAHIAQFDAYYNFRYGLHVSLLYQLIFTDQTPTVPDNVGNSITFRIGKYFYPELVVGYEYYFYDFKHQLPNLYYSPNDFSTHSIWADWDVYKDYEWDVTVGGKVGYAPSEDYIVSDIHARAIYTVWRNLRISAYAFYGNSVRESYGYSSGSFSISMFWGL